MNGNFKVKCVESYGNWLTKGKIYEVKDGVFPYDNRFEESKRFSNFNDFCGYNYGMGKKLILLDGTQSIHIHQNNLKVIATLKSGKETVKTAVAKCNPADEFKFEIGAKLAFQRLFGVDEKSANLTADFKVGDKVKIRENLIVGKYYGHQCFLESMKSKQPVTIEEIGGNGGYYIKEFGLYVSREMIEGKVIEDTIKEPSPLDWSAFKSGKFAVHCDTEEKAREFLKECDAKGIKWVGGEDKASYKTFWKDSLKDGILYFHKFSELTYSHRPDWHTNETIIDYTPSKLTVKEVSRKAGVGEWIKIADAMGSGGYYKNGDILKVDHRHASGALVACGIEERGIYDDEYVVLEGYVPEDKPTVKEVSSVTLMKNNEPIISVKCSDSDKLETTFNPIKEVHRPAKVGEWIRVIDANGCYTARVGDIAKVTRIRDEDGVAYYTTTTGVKGSGFHRRYVVLENYQPEEPKPLPSKEEPKVEDAHKSFVKAKVGDKIKVVKDNGNHGPKLIIGDVHIVVRITDSTVWTDKCNSLDDADAEYIILDSTLDKPSDKPMSACTKEEIIKELFNRVSK